jgi:hypothetical protein
MKVFNIVIILTTLLIVPLSAHASKVTEPAESPYLVKLKGVWYLRGKNECTPVQLDRKGRSEMLLGNRELVMDRTHDYLYLTVKKWPYTYTYRMNPITWGESYVLELMTVGPENPPTTKALVKEYLTGIFRRMVDCQMGVHIIEGVTGDMQ